MKDRDTVVFEDGAVLTTSTKLVDQEELCKIIVRTFNK